MNKIWLIFFLGLFSSLIYGQDETKRDMSQFLFPGFSNSILRMKTGELLGMTLNYNTVSQKMIFEQKGEAYELIVVPTADPLHKIDTIIIKGRKFVPYDSIYLEVLYNGVIPLFMQNKTNLQPPIREINYTGKSNVFSSDYLAGAEVSKEYTNFKIPSGYTLKSANMYRIMLSGQMVAFKSEKQFLSIFPGKEPEIKKFIKEKRIRFERAGDIIKLLQFCEEFTN
jgi:hypothetical protein